MTVYVCVVHVSSYVMGTKCCHNDGNTWNL